MLTHITAGRGASGPRLSCSSGQSPCGGAMGGLPDLRGPHGLLVGEGDVVKKPKARLDAWAEAQKRFHLSDLHIQMARELGLNPKKFGGLANHRQEPWKLPLPEFIAECYHKRFHRERPAQVIPLAEVAK